MRSQREKENSVQEPSNSGIEDHILACTFILSEYISFECKTILYYSHEAPVFEDINVGFFRRYVGVIIFASTVHKTCSMQKRLERSKKLTSLMVPPGLSSSMAEYRTEFVNDANFLNQHVGYEVIVGAFSQLHDQLRSGLLAGNRCEGSARYQSLE